MEKKVQQRDTRQRRIVLETVMRHWDHPSADDIYDDIHERYPTISKATVYRNLKVLSENGEIRRIKAYGADRYDRTLCDHYHVICTVCGAVSDCPIAYESDKDGAAEAATGFSIRGHRMLFEGVCPTCRKRQEKITHKTKGENQNG